MTYEDQIRDMLMGKAFDGAERLYELVRLFFHGDGEVTLHARCMVRVLREGALVACSTDTQTPAIDTESVNVGDFQWAKDFSAYDFCIKGFLQGVPSGRVDGVQLRPWGDMLLSLDNHSQIEILTDSALREREQWRLFQRGLPAPEEHIVCCASGFALE